MPSDAAEHESLIFGSNHTSRLQVSLTRGTRTSCAYHDGLDVLDHSTVHDRLGAAQRALVEQEIFSILIKEASQLSNVPARVEQRLISIDATQGVVLKFEMVVVLICILSLLYG